jgi:serpin B
MNQNSFISANARFAFKLFGELARQQGERNLFVSPMSVMLALAMTYNGARGATERAMAEALELGRTARGDLNQAAAEFVRSLRDLGPQVALAIANSLWARQGVGFKPDFVRSVRESYAAQVVQLDFAGTTAAAAINGWVSEHTSGKIDKIIDHVDASAILFLINAIYFKGSWARQFDRRLTREGPFTLPDGRRTQPMMMSQSGKYRYYEGDGFQAVGLPYGGGRLSMYLFLPATRAGLGALQRSLDARSWDAWMSRFRETEGSVALPRFKIEYEATLNQPLKALGMADAFSRRADFSGMVEDARVPVGVDEVRHKTFVEVNEEGTEAAAATAVTMIRASFVPRRAFSMVVDRPFFCAIRDDRSGALLFMGAIVDPK